VSEVLVLLQIADAALSGLQKYKISAAKLAAMQEQNANGRLTPEQLEQLAQQAHESVSKL
jgi:hydroxyethylthiazole kinase-like sugar kinase family protein